MSSSSLARATRRELGAGGSIAAASFPRIAGPARPPPALRLSVPASSPGADNAVGLCSQYQLQSTGSKCISNTGRDRCCVCRKVCDKKAVPAQSTASRRALNARLGSLPATVMDAKAFARSPLPHASACPSGANPALRLSLQCAIVHSIGLRKYASGLLLVGAGFGLGVKATCRRR